MRKFKPVKKVTLSAKLRVKVGAVLAQTAKEPVRATPHSEAFEVKMDKAFPPHLRGTISGCCDSMADGHG